MTDPTQATTSSSAPAFPEELYRRLRDRYEGEAAALRRRSSAVGRGRLVTFFASLACLAPALVGTEEPRLPWLVAAAILFAAFVALVLWDERLGRRIRRLETLRNVNARSLARRAVDLARLEPCPPLGRLVPGRGDEGAVPPPFARDLYLFGRDSVYRLVRTAHTPIGLQTLATWLVEPAGPAEVARRQEAVRTLADRLDLRQELEARGVEVPGEEPDLERFYAWAEGEPWLRARPLRLWTARVLTLVVPVALGAAVVGAIPWSLFALVALGGYLFSVPSVGRLHDIYDRATAGGDGLRGYGPVFRALQELEVPPLGEGRRGEGEGADGHADLLDELTTRLRPAGRSEPRWAADWMDRLERLTVLSDVRRGVGHIILQVLFLWDFHLAARFEAWQRDAGPAVRDWLGALGEAEALGSLAAVAHAHPEWAWPRVDPEEDLLTARNLGHPLIPPGRRVDNDVRMGPPGTFLLVTGSNMSGKTTLLRAAGVNVVLAQAGGPVCAAELAMPPVRLATSVVVEDSLAEGVSFFMAELLRLKSVVEAAEEEAEHGDGRKLLYLLDEVLRGTNSAERRVAVQRVLGRLLELGAIGAVTTHDLELTTGEGTESFLTEAADTIHFRETIRPRAEGGAEMTFDFVARPGLAPTTNALRLLEAVGLGGEEP